MLPPPMHAECIVKDDIHSDAQVGSLLHVPIWELRYCQETVNSRMALTNERSMFELIDDLQRGVVTPESLGPHPMFPDSKGCVWSLGTRRLMALQAVQAWHRDYRLEILCIVVPRIEWWSSYGSWGLCIRTAGDPRVERSRHKGQPLWW